MCDEDEEEAIRAFWAEIAARERERHSPDVDLDLPTVPIVTIDLEATRPKHRLLTR
jgi:hypothetical protein